MNSGMQNFELDTLAAVLNSKLVWLVHLLTNALLMIAFFYWTRIPEETGWQFAMTVIFGLAIGCVTLWLHSATFVHFHAGPEKRFTSALRGSLRQVPAFLVWTLIFAFVFWWMGQWWDYDRQTGGWIRHLLPLFLRRHIAPRTLFSATHWVTWFVYFFVWPILFLPVGAQVAIAGFSGFLRSAAFRPVREVRFWLVYLVCFLVGAYLPYTLAWMVPTQHSSLSEQTWSMILRLGFGYVLLVTSWIFLCAAIVRVTRGEEPEAASSSAVVSPSSGSEERTMLRRSLAPLRDRRVLLLQAVSAVVLTWTSDLNSLGEKNWQIVLGIVGVLVLVVAFLWLQAGTLAYAAEPDPQRFRSAFAFNLRRIAWALLSLVILLVLMLLPLILLRALESNSASSWEEYAVNIVSFYVVPCFMLPWIMAKVGIGGRLPDGIAAIRRWQYWVGMAGLMLISATLSNWILSWSVSMNPSATGILRFVPILISNLPYMVAWLLAAGLLGYFVSADSKVTPTNVIRQTAT